MRDALGPGTTLGYCTNVHAGTTLDAIRTNLDEHAVAVRDRLVGSSRALGIGLWLPAPAARALRDVEEREAFTDWLGERHLDVFTLNGFPQFDFHEPVVKHAVYTPNWSVPARREYTEDLLHTLARLRGPDTEGSLSTLPLGWRGDVDPHAAASALRAVAETIRQIEIETGARLHVDLEPEPGCVLDRAQDVVRFFEDCLLPGGDEDLLRRTIRVCHDVCHAVVMFEGQTDVLRTYADAGIRVGKVQLSSAVTVHLGRLDLPAKKAALGALREFGEDRYLHQTTWGVHGRLSTMYEDLPLALARAPHALDAEWRVHYHVPVYLDALGPDLAPLTGSRSAIEAALAACRAYSDVRHFEVETYAWSVLPKSLQPGSLAEGIADELDWVQSAFGGAR